MNRQQNSRRSIDIPTFEEASFSRKHRIDLISMILLFSLMLIRATQATDGMSLYLQMEEQGSTTFSERLIIQDNGPMDQDAGNDIIVFDVTWGLYRVEGKFEQDTTDVFNMKLSDCTVTRMAPGAPRSERLLITLLSGHYGPNGDALIFVNDAHVEGQGHGNGSMEVASSYQVWGPSNNGQFSNLGYAVKPSGQNPWTFNASMGVEVFNGPVNYTAGYINVLVADVGDSMDLEDSFEVTLRDENETESTSGLVPGPVRVWTTTMGGNGHCYQAVAAENDIDWFTADAYATETMGAHLATITSEGENDFVFNLIDFAPYWSNPFEGSWGPWIGGLQGQGASEPDGAWEWITGEDWSYAAWEQDRPDNNNGNEDHLHYFSAADNTRAPLWNDAFGFDLLPGFVVEWEKPCHGPKPGDINEDGMVDVNDFYEWKALIHSIGEGLESEQRWFDPAMIRRGDIDGNHMVSESDYNHLHKIVFGTDPFNIDGFNTNLPPLTVIDLNGTFPVKDGTTVTDSMLGGEFDVVVTLQSVGLPGDGVTVEIADGHFCFRQDDSSTGQAICSWDGQDQSATEVRASNGLGGGVDMTGQNGIALDIVRNDVSLNAAVVLFSSVEDSSELNLNIPVITEPTTVTYPFADFSENGNGADLSAVTTVLLFIGPGGGVTGPAHFEIDGIWASSPVLNEPNLPEPLCPEPNEPEPNEPPDDTPIILLDQIHDLPSSANWSVNFPGDNPFDAMAADDFTVPAGEMCVLHEFEWAAEWIPVPLPDPTVNVTLLSDAGGRPGDPLFSETELPAIPATKGDLNWVTMPSELWELGQGTYWLSIQANVPIGTEMRIKESSVPNGNPYVWKNPGGAFGTSCSDWSPATQCLGQQPSLAIRVWGTKKSVTE